MNCYDLRAIPVSPTGELTTCSTALDTDGPRARPSAPHPRRCNQSRGATGSSGHVPLFLPSHTVGARAGPISRRENMCMKSIHCGNDAAFFSVLLSFGFEDRRRTLAPREVRVTSRLAIGGGQPSNLLLPSAPVLQMATHLPRRARSWWAKFITAATSSCTTAARSRRCATPRPCRHMSIGFALRGPVAMRNRRGCVAGSIASCSTARSTSSSSTKSPIWRVATIRVRSLATAGKC